MLNQGENHRIRGGDGRRGVGLVMLHYTEERGWQGGDDRTLYAITDRRTRRVIVRPGDQLRAGPDVDIRMATREEAEEHWQRPLHAGWKVTGWRVLDGSLVLQTGLPTEEAARDWIRGQVGSVSRLDLAVRPDAYSVTELAAIRAEVEHEDEIERLREAGEEDEPCEC
jgi:hypothetical protein